MKKNKNTPTDAAELRRKAEEQLRKQKTKKARPGTELDTQRLLHELQVHQIELEMQNEELKQARAAVEAALERYTDLYDFAPVGYFTLGRDGAIRQANLTGASLLGVERSGLLKRRFELFVAEENRPDFDAFLKKVFAGSARESCVVMLSRKGSEPPVVQIEATASEDGQECRIAVVDISSRKHLEDTLKLLLHLHFGKSS
jgi:PAS domain S-box-containing protein